MESFLEALAKSKNPVVYNGDIFSKDKYEHVLKQISGTESVQINVTEEKCSNQLSENEGAEKKGSIGLSGIMLGRGVLANPALFGEIRENETLSKDRLWEFHERLLADYTQEMSGERNVLFKMKELWFYLARSFTDTEKYEKKIRKAQHLSDYKAVVKQLFSEQELVH